MDQKCNSARRRDWRLWSPHPSLILFLSNYAFSHSLDEAEFEGIYGTIGSGAIYPMYLKVASTVNNLETTVTNVTNQMVAPGNGTSGVVLIQQPDTTILHIINVVNRAG